MIPAQSGVAMFLWVRGRRLSHGFRDTCQAPLKLGVTLMVWTILFALIFVLAYRGIAFINDTAGLGPFLLSRLWFLFLFVVMILLFVSQIANAFSTTIRAPEARYWMTLPVSARTLGRAKWLESSLYSSWAILVLGLPLCIAYILVLKRSWWLVL